MLKSAACLTALFVASLAVSGCQTKPAASDGAGFSLLEPSAATRAFILANDRPFAEDVAGNNRTCRALPACRK